MMRIVVIIPSRYGSSRFDGKPLASICGKPMIQWVYQRASQAACVESVHVATDDERIRDAVQAFGGNVLMTSSTCRSGTDRVAEAAQRLGLSMTDVVINIQGDQPLVDPHCFDAVVQPFYDDPTVKMSTLAFAIVDEREIADPKDVKVTFDNSHPLAYGMPDNGLVLFWGSPTFQIKPSPHNEWYETIVRYRDRDLLQSGWLIGEELIAKKAGMVVA